MTPENARWFANALDQLVGKALPVQCASTTLLSEGHRLLEDAAATGKTMSARAIANTVYDTRTRMASDMIGVTVYDQGAGTFGVPPAPDVRKGSVPVEVCVVSVVVGGGLGG